MLDLGSGGGIDVLLSARRVGPTGVVYGLDMTEEMLALARRNQAEAGITNAHFLRGQIEDVPLPAESVDVVISNCVINLSTDKARVLTEIARVLKPGGRVGVSDVVAEDRLTPEDRAERGGWAGCIAGALSVSEYVAGLEAAGLVDAEVTFTHEVADGMHGAIVKARQAPVGRSRAAPRGGGGRARLLLRAPRSLAQAAGAGLRPPADPADAAAGVLRSRYRAKWTRRRGGRRPRRRRPAVPGACAAI